MRGPPLVRHELPRAREHHPRVHALIRHRVVRGVEQVVELLTREHEVPLPRERRRDAVQKKPPVPAEPPLRGRGGDARGAAQCSVTASSLPRARQWYMAA